MEIPREALVDHWILLDVQGLDPIRRWVKVSRTESSRVPYGATNLKTLVLSPVPRLCRVTVSGNLSAEVMRRYPAGEPTSFHVEFGIHEDGEFGWGDYQQFPKSDPRVIQFPVFLLVQNKLHISTGAFQLRTSVRVYHKVRT